MRISVGHAMAVLECGHARHLFEALARVPGADVLFGQPGDGFDFAFNAAYPTPGAVRIQMHVCDPHGLTKDYDNTGLEDPRFLALLSVDEREFLAKALHAFRCDGRTSLVARVRERCARILALNMEWPFRERLVPKLGPGLEFMRVGPRVPEWIFRPDPEVPRELDAFFIGNDSPVWYPLRYRINRWLETAGFRFSYNPGRPPGDPIWRTPATFDDHQRWYAGELRRTKVVATCGSVFNIAVGKYFEAMACGCLLLAPLPRDADLLGFRDGDNMVEISPGDFADKIRYYLAHPAEREAIARRGVEFCRRRHAAGARAAELVAKLEQIRAGRSVGEVEAEFDEKARMEWAS